MASELETNMHTTTTAYVEGVWSGKWTLEKTLIHRAPDCIHHMLPTSLGVPKRNNEEWAAYFKNIEGLIWDAEMEMHDYTADVSQRKTACRSSLKAMSPAGPYTNEYVWFLTFDESGKKIREISEFVDVKKVEEVRAALGLNRG